MISVYLALGSNLGDRTGNLNAALEMLHTAEMLRVQVSSMYETEPVGYLQQPKFLNMAAEFATSLSADQVLMAAQKVELTLGRERSIVNGPRTIDVDVLFYGDHVIQKAGLEIPHPRLRERRFVLEPLAEIAPLLRDPVSGQTIRQLLDRL